MVGMLKWWFIFVCSTVIIGALSLFGLMSKLWDLDVYKVSFVTLTAYFTCSLFVGWLTWCSSYNRRLTGQTISLTIHPEDLYNEIVQYLPDLMTTLGLIGTVIGFIMMMSAFKSGADPATLQESTTKMVLAGSIALSNTLMGLICSVLTKAQVLNLGLVGNRP
jgi:hypothetical protein